MSRSDGQVIRTTVEEPEAVEVAPTAEITALSGENNAKGQFISCSRQLLAGVHRAGLDVLGAKHPRNRDRDVTNQVGVPTAGER